MLIKFPYLADKLFRLAATAQKIQCIAQRSTAAIMDQEVPIHKRNALEGRGFGPYCVTEIPHYHIKLADGALIAAKFWFPTATAEEVGGRVRELFGEVDYKVYVEEDKEGSRDESTFPSVFEYLPYRKSDRTAPRDRLRHPWLASHGFAVCRADLRGSGDSDGIYYDEYAKQELDDGCEIIGWLSSQPWSNGKVGVYGKSWGGFNGLQLAFMRPKGLAAIISLYSTDNRFSDDIHFRGGCVMGREMLGWASQMQIWNARPPHPDYLPNWKEEWKKRLAAATEFSLAKLWLSHQDYNDYWKHGSICEDFSRLNNIPTLLFGGWHDSYCDAALRMAAAMPGNSRLVLGPWSHEWPDTAVPGPNIGYMPECLDFWRCHLKGQESAKQKEAPGLIWYQCHGDLPPSPGVENWPGDWMWTEKASDVGSESVTFAAVEKDSGVKILTANDSITDKEWKVPLNTDVGLFMGEWLSFGSPDHAGDQASTLPLALTFMSHEIEDDLPAFGFVEVSCDFKLTDDDRGMLAAKLCDVFPSGEARLITFGARNLCRDEKGAMITLEKNGKYKVRFNLDSMAYTFRKGHRLALSLSPCLWPLVWFPRKDPGIKISNIAVKIPLVPKSSKKETQQQDFPLFKDPKYGPPLLTEELRAGSFERFAKIGLSSKKRHQIQRVDEGRIFYPELDVTLEETEEAETSVDKGDPLSAVTAMRRRVGVVLRKGQKVDIRYSAEMSADKDNFYLKHNLKAELNDQDFFQKQWEETVERKLV